jgi:hypothetical protein
MAKITALTALTAPVDTDFMVVVDESTGVTKKMELQYLLVALDGDHLDVDFTPTYYTPASTPAEAADVDDLAAHLYGIDQKLVGLTFGEITGSTTFTAAQRFLQINTSGGAITGTLPSAATLGAGFQYVFKVSDATAAFTIATDGTETIEGADAWSMTQVNETLEIVSDGTNWRTLRWEHTLSEHSALFTWTGAGATLTVGPACYKTLGCEYPFVFWNADLVFTPESGGSNSGSSDFGADGWHYIYIDDSAVDTLNSPELTAAQLLNSTTAPTWSDAKHGWYNGNDRCIFACYESGGIFVHFQMPTENYVAWDAPFEAKALGNVANTTWATQVTFRAPAFSSAVMASWHAVPDGGLVRGTSEHRWRQGGSSGTGYKIFSNVYTTGDVDTDMNSNTIKHIIDSSSQIDIKVLAVDANNKIQCEQLGYYIPQGF